MSRRHTSIFIAPIATIAMALSGTVGVFSQSASAATFPVYRVVAIASESADTLYVALNGKLTRVRMVGIDAPEATSRANTKKGCYGAQAKAVLRQLVVGKYVRLAAEPKLPDKYTDGSLLRYVYVDINYDIGATLLQRGAAKEYMYNHKNYAYRSWYKSLESGAHSHRTGMWSLSTCPMNK